MMAKQRQLFFSTMFPVVVRTGPHGGSVHFFSVQSVGDMPIGFEANEEFEQVANAAVAKKLGVGRLRAPISLVDGPSLGMAACARTIADAAGVPLPPLVAFTGDFNPFTLEFDPVGHFDTKCEAAERHGLSLVCASKQPEVKREIYLRPSLRLEPIRNVKDLQALILGRYRRKRAKKRSRLEIMGPII